MQAYDLIAFVPRDDMPVLAQAAVAHARFESIHPFADGNGRTGRALLHAQLRNGGLARHTLVSVSAGLLADTDRYFQALTAFRDGDIEPIVAEVTSAVFPAIANSRQLIDDVTDARASRSDQIKARRGAAAWTLADVVMTRPVVDAKLDDVARQGSVNASPLRARPTDGPPTRSREGRAPALSSSVRVLSTARRDPGRLRRTTHTGGQRWTPPQR